MEGSIGLPLCVFIFNINFNNFCKFEFLHRLLSLGLVISAVNKGFSPKCLSNNYFLECTQSWNL